MQAKIYKIGPVRTLVDLNGDLTYFKSQFKVSSEPSNNSHNFEMIVLSQEKLDSYDKSQDIKLKTVDKQISGEIVVDSGIYQGHYLLLKSSSPMNCMVEIETIGINPVDSDPQEELDMNQPESQVINPLKSDSDSPNKMNIASIIVIVIIVILLLLGVYYMMFRKVESSGSSDTDLMKKLNSLI
jgi:ATP-dependent Zn protease